MHFFHNGLAALASLALAAAAPPGPPGPHGPPHHVPPTLGPGSQGQCAQASKIRSCSGNTAIKADSIGACCLNTWIDPASQTDVGRQSGLILTTQFWDGGASNQTNIEDSWTVSNAWDQIFSRCGTKVMRSR